jgi:hypothetical protein
VRVLQSTKNIKNTTIFCLTEDDDLMLSLGQSHFLLGKHLDLVPHNVDSSVIRILVSKSVGKKVYTTTIR